MRVEVNEADRAVRCGHRPDLRLRDRVVSAEDDRDHAGGEYLPDDCLDRRMGPHWIGRDDRRVAEVDHGELGESVDLRLEVRPGRAARGPYRARAEAGSRPVRGEIVGRRPDDGDIDSPELGRVFRVVRRREGEKPGVLRLLLVSARPALGGVDHGA